LKFTQCPLFLFYFCGIILILNLTKITNDFYPLNSSDVLNKYFLSNDLNEIFDARSLSSPMEYSMEVKDPIYIINNPPSQLNNLNLLIDEFFNNPNPLFNPFYIEFLQLHKPYYSKTFFLDKIIRMECLFKSHSSYQVRFK